MNKVLAKSSQGMDISGNSKGLPYRPTNAVRGKGVP